MIVRCGRCRVELEVSGPGEFACPACGTRNAVRNGSAPTAPGGPGTLGPVPGGDGITMPPGVWDPPAPPPQTSSVRWIHCPACTFRFAIGEVEQVVCPNCSQRLESSGGEMRVAPAS